MGAEFSENPGITQPFVDQIFISSADEDKPALNLFLKGTNFQIKVWEALLTIPPGFVLSYEDIASHICKSYAIRAVGHAVAANPIAYSIPCHRVICKIGMIGNYKWGTARKQAIIGWEVTRRREVSRDANPIL